MRYSKEKLFFRLDSGFTLTELLIVMVIIGLLAGLVAPKLFQKVGGARSKTAKAQIELFGTALDAFRLDIGSYPKTDPGLRLLRENVLDLKNWDGPYLPKKIPLDPWGAPYIYQSPGRQGEYDLYSLGADQAEGGEGEDKDIVSWE